MLLIGCGEALDTTVTEITRNDYFELALTFSDNVVGTRGNVEVTARLSRRVDEPNFVPNKVLGVWILVERGGQPLDPDSLEIQYTFYADSTVTITETYSYLTPDSVSEYAGGWTYDQDNRRLEVVVKGTVESGVVSFDTEGSAVPVGGFMVWEANLQGTLTFQKTQHKAFYDPSFEAPEMVLSLSALGGNLSGASYSGSSSAISVELGQKKYDFFEARAFYTPTLTYDTRIKQYVFTANSHVSATFNDLSLTLPIQVVGS